jgi:hypothetical protein
LDTFQKYRHRHKIDSVGFNDSYSFISIIDATNTTFYYVFQFSSDEILIFNEKWVYQKSVSLAKSTYAIEVETELFVTADGVFYKTDRNLNVMKMFNSSISKYRGLYYNKTADLIYVADYTVYYKIDVFDGNLTFVKSISTYGYKAHALAVLNDYMYIGTMNGTILVIKDNKMVNIFSSVCGAITSLLLDNHGYMVILCQSPYYAYVYQTDGTDTGIGLKTLGAPRFINFDMNGRLIIVSKFHTNIYF